MTVNVNQILIPIALEITLVLIVVGCVYLKLIPNDLLILALGSAIRGAFTIQPTIEAIKQNTIATNLNTNVVSSVPVVADMSASTPVKGV